MSLFYLQDNNSYSTYIIFLRTIETRCLCCKLKNNVLKLGY